VLGRWNKCGASWPPCNARMEGEVAVTALTDSNFNMTAKLESMTGGESLNIFTRLHERCTVIWILFREMKFPHTHPKKIFIYIYISLYIYIYIYPSRLAAPRTCPWPPPSGGPGEQRQRCWGCGCVGLYIYRIYIIYIYMLFIICQCLMRW
jgi:hypothetical protein